MKVTLYKTFLCPRCLLAGRALRRLAGNATDLPRPIISASSAERVGDRDTNQAAAEFTYDWLIFTSANAVRALVERMAALGISPQEGALPQVAAIGEATAAGARDAGFAVALVPQNYVAEALVESLAGQAAGKRILLARAEVARDVIPDALRAAGAMVDVVDAYRNVLPEAAPELLREALAKGIDATTFTSSSSVTHLAEAARAAGVAFPFAGVKAVSIGPITSTTLREAGWEPAAEASPCEIPGLIAAVVQSLRNR